ncbi:M56 family metallopeptidase [Lentzea nigeriaca]|uniref:M56 family metallopeptidase n=1 Tax=Lentzea nigeriaca TaxID=1128665 RepID=UPI001958B566|nr:M56 family metallopeptidase [Lentzea nigeriaca]MBM7860704.1 Zn-dependent protease with chaperone function [Lentzea nigeriaca]
MILAFALLVGAVVVGFAAPRFLHRLTTSQVAPAVLITWWFATGVSVLLTALGGVVLLLVPGHGPARWVVDRIHECWSAVTHGSVPALDDVLGTVGTLLIAAALARLGLAVFRRRSDALKVHRRQLSLLRIAARRATGQEPLMWLDHDQPLAYSVAGRPSFVVATTGLTEHLSDQQVAAVLAHERAHLRGRHHVLTGLADAAAWAMPFVPLMRQAPAAVRVLVEMAADSAAAAAHGAEAVHSALLRVTSGAAPAGALGMADNGVEQRLDRLARASRPKPWLRVGALVATAVTAPALPAAVGLGLFAVTSTVFCSIA